MRIEAVEFFILTDYKLGKFRSIKQRCTFIGTIVTLTAVMLLISTVFVYLNISDSKISDTVFLIIVAILVYPITIMLDNSYISKHILSLDYLNLYYR